MKSNKALRIISTAIGLTFAVGLTAGALAGCGGEDDTGGKTSGGKPLVLSSDQLDGVFNPFFYTSGADGDVVGQTMIGMLSSDADGNMVAGEDEPCVALDYSVVRTGTSDDRGTPGDPDEYRDYYTDYYFALKDDIKFSDGTDLTINDVLFNIYMYLDPAYTGSSTMYSVDIQGLQAYRTQTLDPNQQTGFESNLDQIVQTRIDSLVNWADEYAGFTYDDLDDTQKADLDKVDELFKEELSTDWNTAMSAELKEYDKYVDRNGNKYFTDNWQIFLYNYGVITATRETSADKTQVWYRFENNCPETIAKTKDGLTGYVFELMLGGKKQATDSYKTNLVHVISMYATANTFRQYLRGQAIRQFLGGEMNVRTVSGITVEHGSTIPGENGQTKDLGKECDILHIRINGEDPKAIQNFGFTVAPLHYYSSHADKFNLTAGQEYFGVEYGDSSFMDEVRYIQVPMGAGPYRASTENGTKPEDVKNIQKTQFFSDNIVYFESNDFFFLGAPKIKKLRYKVISTSLLYDAVKNGEVNYASPSATNEMMDKLDNTDKNVLSYKITDNLGYGYIGINANYVHDINIRRAIMHAMRTQDCIDYYSGGTLASAIYRPMSKTLKDYYPSNITTAYYTFDETGDTSLRLAQEAGYEYNSNTGLLTNAAGETLKFTFTIAGDSEDHPAYGCMQRAAGILNNIGFDITVTRDSTALSKLSAGRLEVWAAAWSSSSDPDMYQVYHKDSSATSILAWGFPWIEESSQRVTGSNEQVELLNELAVRIEQGRETSVVSERQKIYSGTPDDGGPCALDLVMALAVELPTYQRAALYVYQKGLFNAESEALIAQATAFQSPLAKIWLMDFAA